ncbi:hypothetical protein CTE05_33110 [Cellulomonas terrae]|uniref:Uncharacterized protein n=1 Tax=Cellulomonas terrae TaxID=311234 RepID=A0A511JPC6_9CELL|nr:hypothetical protein CTE05_33110 [Cellulomonas terrae]
MRLRGNLALPDRLEAASPNDPALDVHLVRRVVASRKSAGTEERAQERLALRGSAVRTTQPW